MKVRFLKSLWEMNGEVTEETIRRIVAGGYDGFELNVVNEVPRQLPELLDKYELVWSAQIIHNTGEEMARAIEKISPFKPVRFVAHGGRDYFSFDQGCEFFERILEAERSAHIPVAHETHRFRLLYSPYVARQYLDHFPSLRLNADFSHWTVVCESMLEEIQPLMNLACSRSIHLHARVGHEEGPQVSDPRAPEFARQVACFEKWWHQIRNECRSREDDLHVVPEYGPPNYMTTLPYTRQPVADLWEICRWQANRLRELWGIPLPGAEVLTKLMKATGSIR